MKSGLFWAGGVSLLQGAPQRILTEDCFQSWHHMFKDLSGVWWGQGKMRRLKIMPRGGAVAGTEEGERKGVTRGAQPLRAFSGETAEFTINIYLFWALDGNNYYLR